MDPINDNPGISEWGEDESTSSDVESSTPEQRDEVRAIKKEARGETMKVLTWRMITTAALIVTAVAVSWTSYSILEEQEQESFKTAFERFAGTVEDAAQLHMRDLLGSIKSLSHAITVYSDNTNAEWPYFYMPDFELQAQDFLRLSRAEFIGVNNIVYGPQRENYTVWVNQTYRTFIEDSLIIADGSLENLDDDTSKYKPFITRRHPETRAFIPDIQRDIYFPRTSQSPARTSFSGTLNWNVGSVPSIGDAMKLLLAMDEVLISEVRPFLAISKEVHSTFHDGGADGVVDHPHSFVYAPVHKSVTDTTTVATLTAAIAWDASLRNLLPEEVRGLVCVIRNNCGQNYTYLIDGPKALFQGSGDLHDAVYDSFKKEVQVAWNAEEWFVETPGHCLYTMNLYPTEAFEQSYKTETPRIFAIVVALTFALVIIVFFVYDLMVQRRNDALVRKAAQSSAIVTSMFPGVLREKVLDQDHTSNNKRRSTSDLTALAKGIDGDVNAMQKLDTKSKPLAELYLETTVMFADVVGFTAWSSTREPSMVFTLLESLYSSFDAVAKKRRVFKVETVGDCYVAVAGFPDPRPDHATMIARFARDCVQIMHQLREKLELTLGPGTAELDLRVGIHSGPCLAGVIRGDRSRFQLFGDTMNTCARMESTSHAGRIQLSCDTAKLLQNHGKDSWIQEREDSVLVKGKGSMNTYWLKLGLARRHRSGTDKSSSESSPSDDASSKIGGTLELVNDDQQAERMSRLVDWNVEVLEKLLRQIVVRREVVSCGNARRVRSVSATNATEGKIPLEEVKEIIELPEYNVQDNQAENDPDMIKLPEQVSDQLRSYVACIGKLYRCNPFHNFEHASHVVMSVSKLLSRIVASEAYGITSDPLTQFACVISALIHDVDHVGVPNTQLVLERPDLAAAYKNRSVAEQNSLDIAMELLNDEQFSELRSVICADESESSRFRELVVNSVMATDIMDKDLKNLRNCRWEKAFSDESPEQSYSGSTSNKSRRDNINRKATIVIEHLIQASDVSHTMQHWHVYKKWNQRLFEEMYKAYVDGRSEKDPSEFWYTGEIGFFDFYIIPLAKKLKECGVFGISSDEYLNYALNNRNEWEAKGRNIVEEYKERVLSLKTCLS